MAVDLLERLWLDASAFYQVKGEDGGPVPDPDTGKFQIHPARMASDLTIFVIRNGMNESRPIGHRNVKYWWELGRITPRQERIFRAFIDHKRQEASANQ